MSARYPLFVKRDLDGFFGLAIDNLVQLLLIVNLCGAFCGMSGDNSYFIYKHIMPGVAVSLLIGNLFYAAQAHWVARREGRSDVTALPYGINTPSLMVYVFFVMIPAYNATRNPYFAWQMGLIACLGSGIIEFLGAFFAERLRRNTPRAALLSTLAGIAITFIAMTFALQIWQRPLVAMVPMAVVLLVYFSKIRFPLGLPGGLVAVLLGTGLGWGLSIVGMPDLTGAYMSVDEVRKAWDIHGTFLPIFAGQDMLQVLRQEPGQIIALLSVIIPMGLFNVIGSLQNIESAEAGGDVYATGPSLAVNGIGTIAAALFGSCFPTTIYIGHPGWKGLGARAGYSTLNGLVMTVICLTGTVSLISAVVPLEAGIAIVLWIGIVITAQAFQASPHRHAPAAAIGLFPAIVAWGATIVAGSFIEANRNPDDYSMRMIAEEDYPVMVSAAEDESPLPTMGPALSSAPASQPTTDESEKPMRFIATTMQDLIESYQDKLGQDTKVNGFLLHGMCILERGYIFTCMIIAAISAFLIDRRFFQAASWSVIAAVLTLLGLMHAYQLKGNTIDYLLAFTRADFEAFSYRAYPVAMGYLLMAAVFYLIGKRDGSQVEDTGATLEDARFSEPVEAEATEPGEVNE